MSWYDVPRDKVDSKGILLAVFGLEIDGEIADLWKSYTSAILIDNSNKIRKHKDD